MSQHHSRTYLLVGTVTKDLLPDDSFTIGGTVTYAASVARQLGWRPIIVTAAASGFTPPAYLTDVDWRILPSSATTMFRNVYTTHGRQQTVGPIARSIGAADVPVDVRHANLVHLCPLAQDVEPEIIHVFNNALLTATPQGWLRQWDAEGHVSLSNWSESDRVLPKLQAAVISLEDVKGNWALAERWAAQTTTLIVTEGEKGCTIFHQGQKMKVPPRPAQPVDPTGAGDVFAAAFFARFHETGQLWQSARFANVTASMAIERLGPEGVPHRDEIEAYIAQNRLVAP